jgi:hypothetical protein
MSGIFAGIRLPVQTRERSEQLLLVECGREPRDDENAADEWRAFRDISDELPVFCPECAEREFRPESEQAVRLVSANYRDVGVEFPD